jgi:hypothetical protein
MLAASSNVRVQEQSGSYVRLRSSSQFDPARMLADGMIAARIRSTVELDGVSQMLEKQRRAPRQSCYSPLGRPL